MKEYFLKRKVWVPRPIEEVFAFFANAENLGEITPPELGFRIISDLPIEMRADALIDYTIRLYSLPMKWRTMIKRWNPPHSFEDIQLAGPYAKWEHTHTFTTFRGGTTIEDRVVYALPFGLLGRMAHPFVKLQLRRIFSYREKILTDRFSPRAVSPRPEGSSSRRDVRGHDEAVRVSAI